jgi:hypothetical protein
VQLSPPADYAKVIAGNIGGLNHVPLARSRRQGKGVRFWVGIAREFEKIGDTAVLIF